MASIFKPSAATKREGIVYPERVILAILTHGTIQIERNGIEKTFQMPAGISVKRAYASIPGVCNFIRSDTNAYFVRTIKSYTTEIQKMPFNRIDDKFSIFLDVFKEYDRKETVKELQELVKKKDTIMRRGNEDEINILIEAERYLNTYDKFFKISTYLPGDTVIDKLYSRTNSEAIRGPSEKEWITELINVGSGREDIVTLMRKQTRFGDSAIHLSDIIDYLKSQGVKEVVIFDNSCSTFKDANDQELNDREIRRRRRAIETNPSIKFGGKKGKKSYKKRKINKKNKSKRRR